MYVYFTPYLQELTMGILNLCLIFLGGTLVHIAFYHQIFFWLGMVTASGLTPHHFHPPNCSSSWWS